MAYQVDTAIFRGPVDLLLHLVRRHEVQVSEIALADLTAKYLQHIEVLEAISINLVGDFIDVASQLVEIKARAILPRNEHEPDEESVYQADPRDNLVHRLLLFKRFQDAKNMLEERHVSWRRRFSRIANDAPKTRVDPAEQPIHEIELWDLVSAFGRVLKNNRPIAEANIFYDDTPIHVYMKQIHSRIVAQGKVSFSDLFEPSMHKSAMVGVFLAILELSRHHNVEAKQSALHGEIVVVPADGFQQDLDTSNIDDYNPHMKPGDPASMIE